MKTIPKKMDSLLQKETLDQIYTDDSGKTIDVKTIHRAKIRWLRTIIWMIVVFALAGASWWGWTKVSFSMDNVSGLLPKETANHGVTIDLKFASEASSGQEIEYQWQITNQERVVLRDMEVNLWYPDNFIFQRSDPSPVNSYNNLWKIPSLDPGETIKMSLTGQLLGEVGQDKKFELTASYIPINFHSRFEVKKEWVTSIKDSIIALAIQAPVNLINGQQLEYAVLYENKSDIEQKGVIIKIIRPDGFALIRQDPVSTRADEWEIGNVSAHQKGVITILGTISGQRDEQRQLVAMIGYKDFGEFRIQNQISHISSFITPELGIDFAVSGANQELSWGDELVYTIEFVNKSDVALANMQMEMVITDESGMIDTNTFIFPSSKPLIKQKESEIHLIWADSQMKELKERNPGEGHSLVFSVRLLDVPLNPISDQYFFDSQVFISAQSSDINTKLNYSSPSVRKAVVQKTPPE